MLDILVQLEANLHFLDILNISPH